MDRDQAENPREQYANWKVPINESQPEGGVFEEDDSITYLTEYYPPLDMGKSMEILDTIKISGSETIDIAKVESESGVSPEVAENIAVFEWYRKLAVEFLKAYPNNHATTLDVGAGPTIYQELVTGFVSNKQVHLEFSDKNRKTARAGAMKALWEGTEVNPQTATEIQGAHDWSTYFEVMQEMFKNDSALAEVFQNMEVNENPDVVARAVKFQKLLEGSSDMFRKKMLLRPSFRVPGDFFREDLGIGPWTRERYEEGYYFDITSVDKSGMVDLVTASFAVESATKSREKWESGMKNVMRQVKPGGLISIVAITNAEWYRVGNKKMPAVPVGEAELRTVLEANGFELLQTQNLTGSNKEKDGYDGMAFVLAKRKMETLNSPPVSEEV